ncbi:MAG: ATP-binding protein [Thiovulaceae bacterium]|nr:ATP-binding protein [Sulfurimonadaceae bacterium]
MPIQRYISFKSIPSFIVFFPIVSLILITGIVVFVAHDIKGEVIEHERATVQKQHYAHQKSILKTRVEQLVQEIKNITKIEIDNLNESLDAQLETFMIIQNNLISKIDKKKFQPKEIMRLINNSQNYYTLSLFQSNELQEKCEKENLEGYHELIKKGKAYLRPHHKSSDDYFLDTYFAKKIKTGSSYCLLSINKQIMLERITQKMLSTVGAKKLNNNASFQIFDKDGKILTKNHHKNVNNILQKNQNSDASIKNDLLAMSTHEAFFYFKDKDKREIISYAQKYEPFNWFITTHKHFEVLDKEIVGTLTQRISYFNNRIQELSVIIIVVSFIVIILSFFVARSVANIFKRYRNHIMRQNKNLKSFNQKLSKKVKEKTIELNQSEARYRTIFERSRDAIFILDDDIITYCNEAALKMFTRNLKSSLINTSIYHLFPESQPDGNDSKKLLKDYLALTESLGHSRFEWLARKADGTTFFIDVWLQHIEIEDKCTIHVVFRNIDAQKKAQEKIKEQHQELISLNMNLEERVSSEVSKNKKKEQLLLQQSRLAQMGEMISMIAHQWRQPLSAISTSSAHLKLLIELDQYSEEGMVEGLDQVDLYVQHLSQTIDDFREFFKPNKHKEETTLNTLVEKSLAIIQTSLENNHIDIIFDQKNDAPITIYAHEMMQVILNILKNAEDIFIERQVKGATIEISCYEDAKNFLVSFEDNAGGIKEEILEKVFDPYFSTKNEKNGTGLGLYMSKVIVKDHCCGNLEVLNTKVGAKFIISLPKEEV